MTEKFLLFLLFLLKMPKSLPPQPSTNEINIFHEQLRLFKEKINGYMKDEIIAIQKQTDIYYILEKEKKISYKDASTAMNIEKYDHKNSYHRKVYKHLINENLVVYLETDFRSILIKKLKQQKKEKSIHSPIAHQLEGKYTYIYWNNYKKEFSTESILTLTLIKEKNTFTTELERENKSPNLEGKGCLTDDGFLHLHYNDGSNKYNQYGLIQVKRNQKFNTLIGNFNGVFDNKMYSMLGVLIKKDNSSNEEAMIKSVIENDSFWNQAKTVHYTIDQQIQFDSVDKNNIKMQDLTHNILPSYKNERLYKLLEGSYIIVGYGKYSKTIFEKENLSLTYNGNYFNVVYSSQNKPKLEGIGFLTSDGNLVVTFYDKENGTNYRFFNFLASDRLNEEFDFLIGIMNGTFSYDIQTSVILLFPQAKQHLIEQARKKEEFWKLAREKFYMLLHANTQDNVENLNSNLLASHTEKNKKIPLDIHHNLIGSYKVYSRTSAEIPQNDYEFTVCSASIYESDEEYYSILKDEEGYIHKGKLHPINRDTYQIRTKRNIYNKSEEIEASLIFRIHTNRKNVHFFCGLYLGPVIGKNGSYDSLVELWEKTNEIPQIESTELEIGKKLSTENYSEIHKDIRRFLLRYNSVLSLPEVTNHTLDAITKKIKAERENINRSLVGSYTVYYPTPISRTDAEKEQQNNLNEEKSIKYSTANLTIFDDGYALLEGLTAEDKDRPFRYIGVLRKVRNGFYLEMISEEGNYTTISIYYKDDEIKYVSSLAIGLEGEENYTAFSLLLLRNEEVEKLKKANILEKLIHFFIENSIVNYHSRSFRDKLEERFVNYLKNQI